MTPGRDGQTTSISGYSSFTGTGKVTATLRSNPSVTKTIQITR